MEKNEKRGSKPIIRNLAAIAFLLVLAALTAVNLIWPDRDFSPDENRMLEQFPEFSLKALFGDGDKWTLKFEDYVTDQFPFRAGFVGIKAAGERALLKHDTDGVYFAREDTLIERPRKADFAVAALNTSAVNEFAASCGVPVTLALIPNTATVNSRLLPPFAYDGEQAALIDASYSAAEVSTADIASSLEGGDGLFYRTDHHPTFKGAYRIYSALGDALDFTPRGLDEILSTDVTDAFRGTAYASSGAWWVKPDVITIEDEGSFSYTLTTVEGGESTVSDSLYDMDKLLTADEYAVFLGGNHPLQVIRGGSGPRLLILKDSFSHCIAPLLAPHFSEIHLIDMRYFRGSVKGYIADNAIDRVLVMYSVNNYTGEKNLIFLNND